MLTVQQSYAGRATPTLGELAASEEKYDEGQGHVAPLAAAGIAAAAGPADEKAPAWAAGPSRRGRRRLWLAVGAGAVVLVALAVGLGVGLTRHAKAGNSSALVDADGSASSSSSVGASGTATATTSATPSATPTTGGYGSLITFEDGSTMVYNNTFGGKWVYDAADPFNCNSWTPALNQNWTWGVDKVYGVNLGGWLNTEPFIVPALYEKYAKGADNQTAVDEYTLSQNMGSNLTAAMTEHYATFITEQDFAEIAAAGLNWVRIPLPHWAIETWPGEPYLERVAWTYFLKAIDWARKYGLRINLDLHTVPGSQNGWNHSGHLGLINWMYGVMGQANAQRSLDYIRTLAQFISQPEYAPVIQLFGFINEPNGNAIGQAAVGSFYLEAYNTIRDVTGIGAGNGPFLSMHDGFLGISSWYDFLPGADRLALDQHPYLAQPTGTLETISQQPCKSWAAATNTTLQTFGVINAGEWAAAPNDCGLWVNGVGLGSRYDGTYAGFEDSAIGSCDFWNDYTQWNESIKADLLYMAQATQDALQAWFFWTWKIGNSTASGPTEVNPFWHYRLGLAHGWIPSDPRSSVGTCAAISGVNVNEFDGTFKSAYMTGGPGAGTIAAAESSSFPWPVKSFTDVASASMSLLPQYTQTGTPITMPVATYTSPGSSATINAGNGWFNANDDSRKAYAAVSGCAYPSEYFAATAAVTASECGAGLTQPTKRAAAPS